MTTQTIHTTRSWRETLRIIGGAFLRLGDYGPMAAEVRRLGTRTDADLARAGTTRRAEIDRIFGPRAYL